MVLQTASIPQTLNINEAKISADSDNKKRDFHHEEEEKGVCFNVTLFISMGRRFEKVFVTEP
jgi:hypothetical protein